MLALRPAVLALMPSNVVWHEGEIPKGVGFPRVSVTVQLPGVEDRALTRVPQSRWLRASFIVAGLNDESVTGIADRVLVAFEGARAVADGWATGPFELLGDPSTYTDRDVYNTGTDLLPRVCAFTFAATVSRRNAAA